MYCYYHPDREPVASCVNCGQLICAECKVILNGKVYCNPCANRIFSTQTVPIVTKHENWFERHLNWTFIFTLVAIYPFDYLAGLILGIILYSIDPYMLEATVQSFAIVVGLILNIAIISLVGIWVLKKKDRSAWNILLLIVPFGIIIFLYLENRSLQQSLAKPSSFINLDAAKNAARAITRRGTIAGYQDKFGIICARLEENPGDPEAVSLLEHIRIIQSKTINSISSATL
jgi:hypothetical protein